MPPHYGKFIAYFRVSTDRQGKSGLGVDAQREAVMNYLNGGRWTLANDFTEVESGKRNDRPELEKALAACKRQKAKLVIAKLDRLSRNLAFIATLMDSGVEFVAVDNPHANKLTVHILAAVAQHEREIISARTSAALKAAKARGKPLGNPKLSEARQHASGQEGECRSLLGERFAGDPRNSAEWHQVAARHCAGIGSARHSHGSRWRMDAGSSKRHSQACGPMRGHVDH
jgi:DNA invertase Pin-like site-specific DNA recombinase